MLYSILSEQIFEESLAFEDLRVFHDMNPLSRDHSSTVVTRPLRRRLYGILLFEKPHPPITVQEWCAENVFSYSKPTIVKPEKPMGSLHLF